MEDIKELDSKIQKLTDGISQMGDERIQLSYLLEESEKKIYNLNKNIIEIDNKISQTKLKISQIRQNQIRISLQQDKLQERVTKIFRHIWLIGGRSQLQILLSNEDPAKLSRELYFYRAVVASEINSIEEFKKGVNKLKANGEALGEAYLLLQSQRKKLDSQKIQLAKLSKSRMAAVSALSNDISDRQDQIESLKNDRARLEALLDQFEESTVIQDEISFVSAKGVMPWPTKGKLKDFYGAPRNDGKMSWQGVTIHAEKGEEIRAIHHGRVVYSDWFRGLGLLIIIDHGEGYMSLYGHNNSISKNLGDWVTPEMPIATAGNSGGLEKALLYFEIRYKGKPTDPALWCTN